MTKGMGVVVLFLILVITGCGHGGTGVSPNVLAVSVSSSSPCNMTINIPCVSVTICSPGTGFCQTVPDILVDTGSSGLRVFSSVLNLSLSPATDGSSARLPIGECVVYADGSADWGAVRIANVILGNEPPVTVPIQVIDSTFANSAGTTACGSATTILTDPRSAGSNGVLGIAFFQYDYGSYFSCTSTSCIAINPSPLLFLPASSFVQNPVFLLPTDNNGVSLSFPSVPVAGATSVSGTLTLGIETRSNNHLGSGALLYAATPVGALTTVYGGTTYSNSVIDSGTNGIGVPSDIGSANLTVCTVNSQFLCLVGVTTTSLSFSISNMSVSSGYQNFSFNIGDADTLFANNPSHFIFDDIAFYSPPGWGGFLWGLPFFLGKTVYFGYDQQSTPFGTGPFYAY